jgi:hypothetical protein
VNNILSYQANLVTSLEFLPEIYQTYFIILHIIFREKFKIISELSEPCLHEYQIFSVLLVSEFLRDIIRLQNFSLDF